LLIEDDEASAGRTLIDRADVLAHGESIIRRTVDMPSASRHPRTDSPGARR
jgi:hypothetical protein